MPKVTNTFIKSKLNKDLDARLIPNGEYRDAVNVQISRSEGDSVGSLENVLGNILAFDFNLTADHSCIGYLTDESTGFVYIFLTNFTDVLGANSRSYSTTSSNYIYQYNVVNGTAIALVTGSFLNFSKGNPIYGINVLENLLFWTDNRNQPRKINVTLANPSSIATPTYYNNEDQISVAKYNPYRAMELFQEVGVDTGILESNMKDVTSKFVANGGTATVFSATPGATSTIVINNIQGQVLTDDSEYSLQGAKIFTVNNVTGALTDTGFTVDTFVYSSGPPVVTSITLTGNFNPTASTELVFNPNPYYDQTFVGDKNYLKDLFVRFSYRFKFIDGEYSIMAPFTQIAFIPKQDGYFMYVNEDGQPEKDDLSNTYRSTVVSFMENKVDKIKLIIPRPDITTTLLSGLNITEIDILMKESDGLSVKVVETLNIKKGDANDSSGDIIYDYKSTKAFKTLPSDEITRVYDKVPVRAFAQEITGNRVVYANFQDKHTPPSSIDYNIAATEKSPTDLNRGASVVDSPGAPTTGATISLQNSTGNIVAGSTVSGTGISAITTVTAIVGDPVTQITVSPAIAAPGLSDNVALTFTAFSKDADNTSRVDYPNSSLKQNRNYQVGIILSDRYGRQSTVILSDDVTINPTFINFGDSTVYSPYDSDNTVRRPSSWAGDSLKVLFNDAIGPLNPSISGSINTSPGSIEYPGIYNGNTTSSLYNPLGWYSYKIVVKQTEQEYYNVYLPGIMASYPGINQQSLELGSTSHIVLINDNINKVPRDLTEIGPDQKQFRSSVQLFGRVQNSAENITTVNYGKQSKQYYPGQETDTATIISVMRDMFDVPATLASGSGFFQFYDNESNPLISRISTSSKIGHKSDTVGGIQHLAVYETEPVESLLDIFWDTSTSGLITDLNELIDNSTGAIRTFSSWTPDFTEAATTSPASSAEILANDFSVLNAQGVSVIPTSLTIISVIDGNGTNFSGATAYFQLITRTGADAGLFNIAITGGYFNNVYYGPNASLRNFTFNFEAVINSTITQISETASLTNVAPSITSSVPAQGNIFTNNQESTFITIKGVNGSANTALRNKDLGYTIVKQQDASGNNVNFFGTSSTGVDGTEFKTVIRNLSNGSNPMGVGDYTLEVDLNDPSLSVTASYVIKIGTVPVAVNNIVLNTSSSSINGIFIRINQTNNPSNGFYVLAGYTFAQWQNSSIGSITQPFLIDRKNARTAQGSCDNLVWYYSSVSESAVKNLWKDSCSGVGVPDGPAVSNFTDFYYQVLEV